jgi:hypothetical protein
MISYVQQPRPRTYEKRRVYRTLPIGEKIVYHLSEPGEALYNGCDITRIAMYQECLTGYGYLTQRRTKNGEYAYLYTRSSKRDDGKYPVPDDNYQWK